MSETRKVTEVIQDLQSAKESNETLVYHIRTIRGKGRGKKAINYDENGKIKNPNNIAKYCGETDVVKLAANHAVIGGCYAECVKITDKKGELIDNKALVEKVNEILNAEPANAAPISENEALKAQVEELKEQLAGVDELKARLTELESTKAASKKPAASTKPTK